MDITLQASFDSSDCEIEQRKFLYQGFLKVEQINVRHRLFQNQQYCKPLKRELIQRKAAAGVILYDDTQQKFALIEQFRVGAIDHPVTPWQLEVIAGILDGNESAEECIRREALEEAGIEVGQLQHLFSFYPSAGACDEIFHLYQGEVALPAQGGTFGQVDEGENIQLHLIDYHKIDQLFQHQRLANAPVIMALQWLKQHISK